jgi:PAS domain S-box-containing protein
VTTILAVDDEPAALYATSRVLRNAGFDVWEATTGHGALARVREGPDLVLLDIKLPDMTGLEVCKHIKGDPATAGMPVLHLTATYGLGEEQAAALEGGADAYLTHPVEPIVLVATIRALLRAREAEARARRLTAWWQSTFDAIQEGVMLLSRSGQVIRCNQAMAELLGRPVESLVGGTGLALMQEGGMAREEWPLGRALSERRRVSREIQVGDRWFEIVADPVLDENAEVAAVVTIVKDVSDRVVAEAQMTELLNREQAARQEAEQVNRLKDEFLATLSHELRTPLNAIVGWTHILRAGGLDLERTRQAIDTIARNAQAQAQLISDILDVSRIVAGKLRLDLVAIDFGDVVRAAFDTVRPAAEAKGIKVDLLLDPSAGPVVGDADRLQQVAWNVLANAIKFTPKGGRVQVRLELVNSSVRLTVEDNGPGIEPEFLPHVFDRFRQEDSSSTRPHGGLGLGLAIVRHLMELHGGTAEVENRTDGTGAIFRLTLPRPALFASEMATATRERRQDERTWLSGGVDLSGTTVLVLDDDEDARTLLRFVLERCGATVVTAGNSKEAVEALRTQRPHVLLADVEMPVEDGYAFIARVRALPAAEGGTIPAAALTAYASAQDRLNALKAGYQYHVAKPVAPAELAAVVASLRALRLGPQPQ